MRRARSRSRALAALAVVVALGVTAAGCRLDPGEGSRNRILWDHNVARGSNSVPLLAIDATAQARAQHAADRLRYESGDRDCALSHTDGRQMSADYPGRFWGENIGCYPGCANAADGATSSFLGSPQHRNNILSLLYTGFGVGVACNERFLFVAVHFVA